MPKAYFASAFRRASESSKPISNSWKKEHVFQMEQVSSIQYIIMHKINIEDA
jgi:hypothetical protein